MLFVKILIVIGFSVFAWYLTIVAENAYRKYLNKRHKPQPVVKRKALRKGLRTL